MRPALKSSPDQVQRWMQAVIMHPDGPVAGLESPTAREAIDIVPGRLDDVVCRSQSLTSLERLQIYSNAYLARLVECLRDEYPAMVHLLGTKTFDSFAVAYLHSYPSTSYTLANLSRSFPRFLCETQPNADPEGVAARGWMDFLIDLATVERTYSEVFDGPGLEGESSLSPSDLAAMQPDEWGQVRLLPNPSLRFLVLHFPAHEYVTKARQELDAELPGARETYLVVFRRNFIVRHTSVTAREHAILCALHSGNPLGMAIECGMSLEHSEPMPDPETLGGWFRAWAKATWFSGVTSPGFAEPRGD